jgi:hypothetical protein
MVLAAAISAYPSPDVRTANPQTQISFRGTPLGTSVAVQPH